MDYPFHEPDFNNFLTVLKGGRGHRVPNAELIIDRELKEAFLGRSVETLEDDVEFRYRAGYDYIGLSIGIIDPAGTVNAKFVRPSDERHFQGMDDRVWADTAGVIATHEDLARYPFPDVDALDYSPFSQAQVHLRPGMKVISVLGKIFTAAWMLMGMERFFEAVYTQPDLVRELIDRIGTAQVRAAEKIAPMAAVGAFWMPDDIAYHSGPMLAPDWLDRNVFSYYRRIVAICHAAGKPVIYHSDGDLTRMLDVILDCGFDGLHPIEPESMDVYELRERVGRRLCLVGNIRVHTLSVGTPGEVRELVRDRIERLGHDGAYMVGASNSVPNYIPFENYLARLHASEAFGAVPA